MTDNMKTMGSSNDNVAMSKTDEMTVKNCMTKDPECINPDATIKEAANKMNELNTGSLPVGNAEELVGFITDRDIAIKAISKGKDPEITSVDEIMTDEVIACHENDELADVCDNMKQNEVLRLIVRDENEKFVGVITHGQIAKAAMEHNDESLCKKVVEIACYDKIAA